MDAELTRRLVALVGDRHALTGVDCSPYVLEGRTPEAVVFPGTKEEVGGVLIAAAAAGVPVTPWGGGTRISVGLPPARAGIVLSLKRLDRLVEHEPGDLTATAEAGMTLEAFQAALGQRGQWLSLDPPYADQGTLGGILAGNASGPRRHLYGTARDLLIGLTMVLADGSVVRGGGKVVKNVAGYDLPKLAIGSYGTLGVIVEATMKLRPRPETDRMVVASFERVKDAGQGARAVMASDLIPSALDLMDADALRGLALGGREGGAALLVGLDGLREQVEWQIAELQRLLATGARVETRVLDGAERDHAWRAAGELPRRAFADVTAVMKWGVLPTQVADLIEHGGDVARRHGLAAAFTAHAGVGIVTAVLGAGTGPTAATTVAAALGDWRTLVRDAGGHAALEWAPLAVKERVPVWDAPGAPFRIMQRLKAELDPSGILNPGRFVGGI
ncbi:MAG TPA: FAD-binding oxidoreductase [Methylomirabilota bacterium]|nr:FAD-binding oxidoreductase [Methylomirabilota bacterium]